MSIKGQLQSVDVNSYGYTRIRVSGLWYGGDKKGVIDAKEGDFVEFENFKNAKGYETFKYNSLRTTPAVEVPPVPAGGADNSGGVAPASTPRETYWSDKAATDAAKEPKIAYFAASERAVQFVALAHSVGALGALAKAKETAKLDILTALVDEQTQRILVASYAQAVPTLDPKPGEKPEAAPAVDDGEKWK